MAEEISVLLVDDQRDSLYTMEAGLRRRFGDAIRFYSETDPERAIEIVKSLDILDFAFLDMTGLDPSKIDAQFMEGIPGIHELPAKAIRERFGDSTHISVMSGQGNSLGEAELDRLAGAHINSFIRTGLQILLLTLWLR